MIVGIYIFFSIILGICLSTCFFIGGLFVFAKKNYKLNILIEEIEGVSKAKVIKVPKGDEKKILDKIKQNKELGHSTTFDDLYN